MAPALGEGPKLAQEPRQKRLGPDPHVCTGRTRLPIRSFHIAPQQLDRPTKFPDGPVSQRQLMGCFPLQGPIAVRDREIEGLPARRHRAVGVSCETARQGYTGEHPSQPSPIVKCPGQGLGLTQQGEAPPMLAQLCQGVSQREVDVDG